MDGSFWLVAAIGFAAQLVDGALGMAYGITATSLLLSLGYSPALASAAVHAAEVVTCGAAGVSHAVARNILWPLVFRLGLAGAAGGFAGALILVSGIGGYLLPIVSIYLCAMGIVLIFKAFRTSNPRSRLRGVIPLGLAGGFLDAIGGGGWGPVVSGTLLISGKDPRHLIGSSALAEFFVTTVVTITFAGSLPVEHFGVTALALVAGGLPAAPLAAILLRTLNRRVVMVSVGVLVALLGAWGVMRAIVA